MLENLIDIKEFELDLDTGFDSMFLDDPFEGLEVEPPPSEAEIIDRFIEGVLQDKRLSHIDRERLETAARIIARGLSGDPDVITAMEVLATGAELANTPLGWMVTRYVKKCRK